MATFTLVLDKRRAKQNGTFPLVFRIGIGRKNTFIRTGIYILENQFDSSRNIIKDSAVLNEQLILLDSAYRKRFYQYILTQSENENIDELKDYLLNKLPDEISITEFWEEHVATLNNSGRNGGARVYKMSLSVLSKNTNLSIPFSKFSYKDLLLLESKLYKNGMSANGIGVYMRSFRAICNKAINMDLIGYEWYPFRKFKIKKEKTTPRVLSIIEMRSYFNYPIQPTHLFYKSWLIGKLILMLRGINLKDLLLLTTKNIKGNRIIYKRAKTGKIYSIKITDEVEEVLKQFTPNNTLLGILSNADILDKEKLVNIHVQKRKVINSHLSKIGKMLEVNEAISTYVFRYSYANIAKQLGYSKDLIGEALGHNTGSQITGIYLEQFDLEIVDDMNEKIITFITQNK
jgi:integrase/recombinase XerD